MTAPFAASDGVAGEDANILADMVRQWVARESPVAAFRARRDGGTSFSGNADAMADMGWFGTLVPEAFGGSGLGFEATGAILAELGRALAISSLASASCVAWAIDAAGSEAQRSDWLPRIAGGTTAPALAIEQAPSAFDDGRVVATPVAGGWRLDGVRHFVADADGADLILISAQTDQGPALFLLPAATEGVAVSHRDMFDALSHANLLLDAVAVGDEMRLPGGGAILEGLRDRACALASAEMLGLAEEGFARTLDYLKTRIQFGEPIGNFQALQHRAVALFESVEQLRPVIISLLKMLDSPAVPEVRDAAIRTSLAKALAGDTLHLLGREMIQMHGGIGMTDEHDAGLFLKRGAVLQAMWGNAAFHRDRFACLRGY